MAEWSDGLEDWAILSIWNACSRANEWPGPVRENAIKRDLLACTSRHALHYGLGGEIHELTLVTVGLKSGLRLGFIRSTGSMAESEVEHGDAPGGPDSLSV